jgi:MFS superfamily sulfate permease-like transporter
VLFGGIPATGAIARTAANVKNGGRTPIAGMTHALVLLVVLAFFNAICCAYSYAYDCCYFDSGGI